jgi:protein O-GlcNAc transferase
MAAMDCLIADRFHIRPGEESGYRETVLRLPGGYACYGPPPDAPQVQPLPALSAEHVTFGSFNNPAKFSASILSAWAEVLRRVPGSVLLLKYDALEQPVIQQRLRQRFAELGVDPDRIRAEGHSDLREHMAAYGRVDIALDTQPYSGGLTTCDALWMGVPVVTFPGRIFASRHTQSHLTSAGCEQFVAADIRGYVELAVDWAGRIEELAELRQQLRERVRRSPLCDASTFARDLLALLQQAWSRPG